MRGDLRERACADVQARGLYDKQLTAIAEALAAGLPEANREHNAWAILALLTGAMTMAHAVHDDGIGGRIADATVHAICALTQS